MTNTQKVYSIVGKTTKPVPYRLKDRSGRLVNVPERFVINQNTDVLLEFKNESDFVMGDYKCQSFFLRGELADFRIMEHEVTNIDFEDLKDNTQPRYALTLQDAKNRVTHMTNQYRP